MYRKRLLIIEIYCVKCKRKTPSLNIRSATTKNNRSMVKGECKICGATKNCVTKSKAGGKLGIHSLIGKLQNRYSFFFIGKLQKTKSWLDSY